MLSTVGITKFYGKEKESLECTIKQNIGDFIVQEVNEGRICQISSIIDLDKFYQAEDILGTLPQNLTKEERKEIYSIANYHPFLRLVTKNGCFAVENSTEDVFVFTIMKYNYSANSMVHMLSKRLSVYDSCIQMGGTKDKRGITFQEVSIKCIFEKLFNYALSLERSHKDECPDSMKYSEFGYRPELDEINQNIINEFSKHMEICVEQASESIKIFDIRRGKAKKIGDLDGNRFTIKIRGIEDIKHVPTKFVNYFGQQRFGINFNNHVIGEHILNKRYDEAINGIMEETLNGNSEIEETRQYSKTQKYILKMKSNRNHNKYIINSLSRNTRMTYLHAFQSYKFNLAINKRLESDKLDENDRIERDGSLIAADQSSSMDDILLPLEKMDDKLLKGGYRRMIEHLNDFHYRSFDGGVEAVFFLKKSCYATMALRELVGDSVYEN